AGVESTLSSLFLPQLVGTYDPARLKLASANDPLASFYQPGEQASDFPSALLQGAPPLITSLEAVQRFLPAAPIGSIRVKAAGDTVDSVMRAGKAIEGATGLQVQIVRGAAMRPVQVLGTGAPVTLQWPQVGAFLDYSRELERGDLAVLTLVGIVGLLFILATAIVHVLLRGKELATLAALGWRRNSLLVLVGVEAAAVGGTGGLLALVLLRTGPALVAAGLTILIYTLGALAAAALSGVGRPGLSLRSGGVTPHKSLAHVDSIRGSAWATFRARRRNALILLAIALPTALLLAMAGIASHLEEPLFVDVAGAQVMLNLRPLHWGAVAAAFVLAAGTAADLIALSVTERRGELAILRAIGWRASAVQTHVIWEGALSGLAAGVLGLLIGSGMLLWAFGRLPGSLWLQMPIVLCVPVLTGLLGALLPARWAARLQTAQEVKGL
ncbi:MAG TPA: FtsX-like permease family protein, partial [Symbiobacteriaceae bacterium]|nr:FtsX-like permease family protein [Symbiobacteriaceae bacterium]